MESVVLKNCRVKSRSDFFKTEQGKCREGLNMPDNFGSVQRANKTSIIMSRKVDRYIAHGCHGVNNLAFFNSVTFIRNGNPMYL